MRKREKSCGAVVYTKVDGQVKYIIIRNKEGIYGFPKGHVENGETEVETALREVFEETNLKVELVDGFRTDDSHLIPRTNVVKDIVYFLGYFEGQDYRYRKAELSGIMLVAYEEALKLFQFPSSRRILTEADEFLNRT